MFNMLAILLGFAGFVLLIAGVAASGPQVIVREARRSIDRWVEELRDMYRKT